MKTEFIKLAFVATGGGTSSAYSAGVAWALEDMGIKSNIFVGSSGSAGTLSYALCGRAEQAAKQFWIEETSRPNLVRRGFHPFFDIDFLVDSMRDRFPFNISFDQLDSELLLAVTDCENGELAYISSKEKGLDWYEVIRASMAMPFFYNKQILIKDKKYIDGDLSATTADHCLAAQQKGATTVICCETSNRFPFDMIPYVALGIFNKNFRRGIFHVFRKMLKPQRAQGVNVIHICPSKKLPTGTMNNSKAALTYAVECGYNDTRKNPSIIKLINSNGYTKVV